jgi:hypothetical protein
LALTSDEIGRTRADAGHERTPGREEDRERDANAIDAA